MSAWVYRLAWVALMALPVAATGAPLKHDPFTRPSLSGSTSSAGASISGGLKLIAVIVAGKKSLVNLNGAIIGIGEEKDGYRLIEVRDHQAIFKKNNKRIVLDMEVSSLKPDNERGSQ